jgi:hydroxymethylpyrimidine/phosphomethylpyrimidine kinase
MIATSGAALLKPAAIRAVCDELFPLAALVTPNLDEAELLLEINIRDEEDLRTAAREIVRRFGCAALVKGGHLKGTCAAVDVFNDGRTELLLTAPFVRGVSTHGTGCTYSAAITAGCARGEPLPKAIGRAKTFITQAIAGSQRIGRHFVLNWRQGGA